MSTFYLNKSDRRYVKKTLEVVYDDVELTYIDKTDISNPVIKLGKAMDPLAYNYVYIPEFNRYYYMSQPTFEAGFYKIQLHCDVLMSFYEYYKNRNVIVKRQESKYNLYLEDSQYKVQNRTATMTKEFPSGFNSAKYIVMGVVGKKQEEG